MSYSIESEARHALTDAGRAFWDSRNAQVSDATILARLRAQGLTPDPHFAGLTLRRVEWQGESNGYAFASSAERTRRDSLWKRVFQELRPAGAETGPGGTWLTDAERARIAEIVRNAPPPPAPPPKKKKAPATPASDVVAPELPFPSPTAALAATTSPTPVAHVITAALKALPAIEEQPMNFQSLVGSLPAAASATAGGIGGVVSDVLKTAITVGGGILAEKIFSAEGSSPGRVLGLTDEQRRAAAMAGGAVAPFGFEGSIAPFRTGAPRAVPVREIMGVNPATGRTHVWLHAGRPILYTGDLAAHRRVNRLAARFGRRTRRTVGRKRK